MRKLFILLMVIFVIDLRDIFAFESKRDAPVAADFHGPSPSARARQLMQIQTRQSHVSWMQGDIQTAQNQAQAFSMLGLDS